MTQRDLQLDLYRAIIMIYILCVIHVAYWLGAGAHPFNSLILFEMPVIFFISGASLQLSGNKHNLRSISLSRFKRVLLPFYAYAFCLLIITCLASGASEFIESSNFPVLMFDFKNILIPADGLMNFPFNWHLWFIVPFLVISISYPLQLKAIDKIGKYPYLLILLGIFATACLVRFNFLMTVLGYNFFFVAGFLFYKKLSLSKIIVLFFITLACFGIMIWSGISPFPMQSHKFPPDIMFVVFGFLMICLLGIIFTFVKFPANRLLERWNKHGYTIYIWQPFVFGAVYVVLEFSMVGNAIKSMEQPYRFAILAIMIFLLATATSFIFVPIERAVTGVFINCYNSLKRIYLRLSGRLAE